MDFGIDVAAEAMRLAGAVLVGAALWLVLLGERQALPLRVALAGGVVLTLGSVGLLFATVTPIAARLDEALLPLALEYVEQTSHGRLLLAPILPAAYALMLLEALRGASSPRYREVLCWMLGAAVFAIGWLFAIGGHGSMPEGQRFATPAQVLHVAGALAWVALVLGLLPGLLRGTPLAAGLRRLGDGARWLVLVLLCSGLVSAWSRGVEFASLTAEPYGQLLLLKSSTFALALGIAGWNRFVELRADPVNEARVRRLLGLETAVLLTALLLAAWLSRTPPPV